jgi:hypothetical protein
MESNILISVTKDRREAEVVLAWDGHVWKPSARGEKITCSPSRVGGIFWGKTVREAGKTHAEVIKPAIQVFRLASPAQWKTHVKPGEALRGAWPIKTLLQAMFTSGERWYGPFELGASGQPLDPALPSSDFTQIEPPNWQPIAVKPNAGIFVAPPDADESFKQLAIISARGHQQVYEELADLMDEAAAIRLREIKDWLPTSLNRLELDAENEIDVQESIAKLLLQNPAFVKRFALAELEKKTGLEWEIKKIQKEIDAAKDELKGVRTRKKDEIRKAIEDLISDDRSASIVALIGIVLHERQTTIQEPPSSASLEELLQRFSLKSEVDALGRSLGVLESGLSGLLATGRASDRPEISLDPLVEAVRRLSPAAIEAPQIFTGTSTATTSPDELQESLRNPAGRAIACVCRGEGLPVVFGPGAAEATHSVFSVLCGKRQTWWNVPADLTDVRALLQDPQVRSLFSAAQEFSERLFGLVLEGINRAPAEAYLEPLLIARALQLPLPGLAGPWPKNLLCAGTLTEGETCIRLSPSIWRRAIPIPAEPFRVPACLEASYALWTNKEGGAVSTGEIIPLLPEGVSPVNHNQYFRARAFLELDDNSMLEHAIAAASCLASGRPDTKPSHLPSDRERVFAKLFTSL